MANRIRTRGLVRASAPRRATDWLASADIDTGQALAAGAAILDQSFTSAQVNALGPLTITRTVGWIAIRTDQNAANEDPFGALGMMVVREQARVAGIASVPTPVTEEFDDGFFVYVPWISSIRFGSAIGFQDLMKVFHFDSRAQRKVTPDDSIVVTVENASAADGLTYFLKFRMLVKLH